MKRRYMSTSTAFPCPPITPQGKTQAGGFLCQNPSHELFLLPQVQAFAEPGHWGTCQISFSRAHVPVLCSHILKVDSRQTLWPRQHFFTEESPYGRVLGVHVLRSPDGRHILQGCAPNASCAVLHHSCVSVHDAGCCALDISFLYIMQISDKHLPAQNRVDVVTSIAFWDMTLKLHPHIFTPATKLSQSIFPLSALLFTTLIKRVQSRFTSYHGLSQRVTA